MNTESVSETAGDWIDVTPKIWSAPSAQRAIRSMVLALRRLKTPVPSPADIEAARKDALKQARGWRSIKALDLAFCVHVFCDLRAQGWHLRCTRSGILALAPANGLNAFEEKARVRAAHELDRDQQLRQPAVRRFIREMERRRLHKGEWRSIFSLMRDGADLAGQLREAAAAGPDAPLALRRAIDPYVQVAASGAVCEFSGLDLFDVWRYFRHTWTTTYQSTPGRKLFFLIRDRAAPCHPVIGIAALGSPIVQLTVRDEWIGWTPNTLLERMASESPAVWRAWVQKSLQALIDGLFVDDFIDECILRPSDLSVPRSAPIERLKHLALEARAQHRLYPQRSQHKRAAGIGDDCWANEARTHLFRSKRAACLAELLRARAELHGSGFMTCPAKRWAPVLSEARVRQAIATIVRHVKATHVGVDVMDITVCGAVAPYNHLLGGKLVSLMVASPEVRNEYHRRYESAASIIASSMAGRAVVRRPKLVLLGTTSLYSVAPSQYNRLRMPISDSAVLSFKLLGQTVGYGSYHFSQATIAALEPLLSRLQGGRPVNSIFGEGVNPKLRKIRAALDVAGLPSNVLLQHGSPRIVYGVALAENFRDVLLGVAARAEYLLHDGDDARGALVNHWRERWLAGRIQNTEVLERVGGHSLTVPVRHGARVPRASDEGAVGAAESEAPGENDQWPLLPLLEEGDFGCETSDSSATPARRLRSRRRP